MSGQFNMKFSEVCFAKSWSDRFGLEGRLALLFVNDTIHVLEYRDPERSITVDFDIVKINVGESTVSFTFPRGSDDRLLFKVGDVMELKQLCKAQENCQQVCDLKLRLNCVIRDSYYSGLNSKVDSTVKISLSDEICRIKKEVPEVFFGTMLTADGVRELMDEAAVLKSKSVETMDLIKLTDVGCVFCSGRKLVYPDIEFVIHPFVPVKFSGETVYMCSICVENWKEYRDSADHDGNLVLEDEINEELCAVCSDTPEELVMCGSCPRSYCNNCLGNLLTPTEKSKLTSEVDVDWTCMCCVGGIPGQPQPRTAWRMVGPAPARRGVSAGTHGVLQPYKRAIIPTSMNNKSKVVTVTSPPTSQVKSGTRNDDRSSVSTTSERRTSRIVSAPPTLVDFVVDAENEPVKRGRGRWGHHNNARDAVASAETEEDGAEAHGAPVQVKQRGKKNGKQGPGSGNKAAKVGFDENYYFCQYVAYHAQLSASIVSLNPPAIVDEEGNITKTAPPTQVSVKKGHTKRKQVLYQNILTDEVCFLCKDGGDLVECDWRCPTAKSGERCLKVYHAGCLDYEVPEKEKWNCPRHFCDMCGSTTLKYVCKYCPISLCSACPEKFVEQFGSSRYCEVALSNTSSDPLCSVEWCHHPVAKDADGEGRLVTIVCQTCLSLAEQVVKAASPSTTDEITILSNDLSNERTFPGHYAGDATGALSPSNSAFRRVNEDDAVPVYKGRKHTDIRSPEQKKRKRRE